MPSDPYPRECPHCEKTLETASAHDLHMERVHTDEEADRAVAEAVVDEIVSEVEAVDE